MAEIIPLCPRFNFDYWMRLAQNDPAAFERQRATELDNLIDCQEKISGRREKKLQQLKFRLDAEHARAKTPLAGCLKAYTLMWDSAVQINEQSDELAEMWRKWEGKLAEISSSRSS